MSMKNLVLYIQNQYFKYYPDKQLKANENRNVLRNHSNGLYSQ